MSTPSTTTICIVEDAKVISDILELRINRTDDMKCLATYNNAEAAIRRIPDLNPDIVIMDIGLPGASGIEAITSIKQRQPGIAFLVFTVFDNDDNIFNALKAGAAGYIMKDEKPSGVIAAIREFLDGGAPMSAAIGKRVLQSFRDQPQTPSREDMDLSPRQLEILELISKGHLNKEIADKLCITEGSVKVQVSRIYKKLQVNNRVEAINRYNRGR